MVRRNKFVASRRLSDSYFWHGSAPYSAIGHPINRWPGPSMAATTLPRLIRIPSIEVVDDVLSVLKLAVASIILV